MHVLLISLCHKNVPVEIREKLSFSDMESEKALVAVKRIIGVNEAMLLSTCNRTELVVHHNCEGQAVVELEDVLRQFLCCRQQVELDEEMFCSYYDLEAVDHLFRVSVGLESLVLGESQILGQIKSAYTLACRIGATGFMLNRLLHRAFRVGKRSRTETKIGMGISSVSQAAAAMTTKKLGANTSANVLIIGAGEMSLITAKELAKNGSYKLTIANRSINKAETLAKHVDAKAIGLDALNSAIAAADAVISAVGVKEPIITTANFTEAVTTEKLMVDIGVPRNIAPEVGALDNVTLAGMDDLKETVSAGMKMRQGEVARVEAIIEEEISQFESWFRSLSVEPTIKALIANCEDIRTKELDRVSTQLSDEEMDIVNQVTGRIVKKILHNPIRHLKTCHTNHVNTADYWVEMVNAIFDLEVPEAEEPAKEPITCPHAMARKG